MKRTRNQKGFTIMELMIVIIIIGILIAIAVPAYTNFRARAITAACKSNQRTLESADGLRFADLGTHAAAVGDLAGYIDNAAAILCPGTPAGTYSFAAGVVSCSFAGH